MPELVREALGEPDAVVKTVHRLDRVVSGLMVLARTARAASDLSAQIRAEYLAVCRGTLPDRGVLRDLLLRDPETRLTRVVQEPGRNVQPAELSYETLARTENSSLARILLKTGRTHQIRVQFSSRGHGLLGDRRYGEPDGYPEIALWSHRICFRHPRTGEALSFSAFPAATGAWAPYAGILEKLPVDFSAE